MSSLTVTPEGSWKGDRHHHGGRRTTRMTTRRHWSRRCRRGTAPSPTRTLATTTYACDPDVGGIDRDLRCLRPTEIRAATSSAARACGAREIRSKIPAQSSKRVTATPMVIPAGETMTHNPRRRERSRRLPRAPSHRVERGDGGFRRSLCERNDLHLRRLGPCRDLRESQ